MTTRDREGYRSDLHAYLNSLDHEALTRVADAPLAQWTQDGYVTLSGRRCLLGHAEDWYIVDRRHCRPSVPSVCGRCPGEEAFHALVEEDGLERTVGAVRLLASVLLHSREETALRALLERRDAGVRG